VKSGVTPKAVRSEILTEKNIAAAAQVLASRDKQLSGILKKHGPPPLWKRPQGFHTLVRIILEQQVSLASAASIYNRLATSIDPFEPTGFIRVGESHFRSLGVTRQKSSYLLRLAESIEGGQLSLRALSRMTDPEAKFALMNIKGIGSWSADIYLLMGMRRADIWPSGDLAVAATVMELKQLSERPKEDELIKMAEGWRPYRAVAARMLWQSYLAKRNRL
jgi:DNA-3-methyladenine glycosylase II